MYYCYFLLYIVLERWTAVKWKLRRNYHDKIHIIFIGTMVTWCSNHPKPYCMVRVLKITHTNYSEIGAAGTARLRNRIKWNTNDFLQYYRYILLLYSSARHPPRSPPPPPHLVRFRACVAISRCHRPPGRRILLLLYCGLRTNDDNNI